MKDYENSRLKRTSGNSSHKLKKGEFLFWNEGVLINKNWIKWIKYSWKDKKRVLGYERIRNNYSIEILELSENILRQSIIDSDLIFLI